MVASFLTRLILVLHAQFKSRGEVNNQTRERGIEGSVRERCLLEE